MRVPRHTTKDARFWDSLSHQARIMIEGRTRGWTCTQYKALWPPECRYLRSQLLASFLLMAKYAQSYPSQPSLGQTIDFASLCVWDAYIAPLISTIQVRDNYLGSLTYTDNISNRRVLTNRNGLYLKDHTSRSLHTLCLTLSGLP